MVRICHVRRKRGDEGFTLLEVLVALAVLSVATYVIMQLFMGSVGLGQADRSRRTAMALAEERMADISMRPGNYQWPDAADQLTELTPPGGESEGVASEATPPTTKPTYPQAGDREAGFYSRFSWKTFVRYADAPPGTCEVTVVVNWEQDGKPQSVSLTSLLPRPKKEGQA